jgi:hypothetical protein
MRFTRLITCAVIATFLTMCYIGDAFAAESRVRGTPARFEGALKIKEMTAPGTPPTGFTYVYIKTDGIIYTKNDSGVETALGTTDSIWGTTGTNESLLVADNDILLHDGSTLGWGDANPGTLETYLADISAGIIALSGGAAHEAEFRILEDESNGTNYVGISVPASLVADYTLLMFATAPANQAIPYFSAASTLASDEVNFAWDDASNANTLTLGAGTAAGTIELLEGSGGGTNTVGLTAPATLAGDIEFTMPSILPTTAGKYLAVGTTGVMLATPAERMIYAALAPAPTHDGTTAAETALTPASVEGSATIPVADLLAGATFHYNAQVTMAGDADGDEAITFNVYFGTQLVGTSGAIAVDGASTFYISGIVKIKTVGAGGTGVYNALFANGVVIPTTSGAAFTAFDTTATKAFSIKADFSGTTDAADTCILNDLNLSVNNTD